MSDGDPRRRLSDSNLSNRDYLDKSGLHDRPKPMNYDPAVHVDYSQGHSPVSGRGVSWIGVLLGMLVAGTGMILVMKFLP
jgi:hypothetical protein